MSTIVLITFLQDLETVHNSKLMAEYEKYQELQNKMVELQGQWEKQMRDLQAAKEKSLAELTAHFEAKLKDKQSEINQVCSMYPDRSRGKGMLIKVYYQIAARGNPTAVSRV